MMFLLGLILGFFQFVHALSTSKMHCMTATPTKDEVNGRTCAFENVCHLRGEWLFLAPANGADSEFDDEIDVEREFINVGSYQSSPKMRMRVVRPSELSSDVQTVRFREPTFVTMIHNPMFWHFIGDELFSLHWMLTEHADSDALRAKNIRLLLWSTPSRHAAQLVNTVTKHPLLVLDDKKPHMTCFDTLYVGPAARQLGGPGSKFVDAAAVRAFRQFISSAFDAPDVVAMTPVANEPPRVLLDVRASTRRILNADEFAQTLQRLFDVQVDVIDLSTLPRADQLQRLSATTLLVAMHGSSLANMLWLPPDAHVLELFPFGFERPTYEYVAQRWLSPPHAFVPSSSARIHYHRWQNSGAWHTLSSYFYSHCIDRGATVFHEQYLKAIANADERRRIVDAPRYDYRMSWTANLYWINQDTRLPLNVDNALFALIANALQRPLRAHTEL